MLPPVCVETPYGQLRYPGIWKDYIRTEVKTGDSCVVSFFGTVPEKEEQQLFDVVIGGSGEVLMGTLNADTGSYDVSITMYPLNTDSGWSVEDSNLLFGMQDSVNDVIGELALTKPEAEESVEETETMEMYSVETPYGELQYPGIWEGHVRSEVISENGCTIRFFGSVPEKQEQRLFDIVIGGSGESFVGMVTKDDGSQEEVYVTVVDLPEDAGWAEEAEQFNRMQEIMNILLDQLALTEPIPEESEGDAESVSDGGNGDITVSTYYATLQYPGKWQRYVRTAIMNEAGCKVCFFGTVPGYAEVHLFDIVINGTCDIPAGTLTTTQGTAVPVGINIFDIVPEENMTDDETGILYGMQEDMNYILEKLVETGKFSF